MFLSVVFATCVFLYVGIADEEIPGNTALPRRVAEVKDVDGNKYPFMVQLYIKSLFGEEYIFCGGSIIALHYVLTAAHCMDNVYIDTFVRENNVEEIYIYVKILHNGDQVRFQWDSRITHIFRHPDYDGNKHDIAILHTREKLAGRYTKANIDKTSPPLGTRCTLLGSLAKSEGDTISFREVDVYPTGCQDNNFNLCTSTKRGRRSCLENGFNGGVLVTEETPGEYRIIGILTHNTTCADGVPNIYTDVSLYHKWINETIKTIG